MSDIYRQIDLLDHGFIRLVDKMGDDSSVVQAARVSYGKGTKTVNQDKGLINYLMRNDHSSPFEMVEFKFHVKMPIFVARQWIRHRTASVNEYSGRYSIIEDDFYIPSIEQIAAQSTKNHQGRSDVPLSEEEALEIQKILTDESDSAYDDYLYLMNENTFGKKIDDKRQGLARELARTILPINVYTQWYWKANLRNIFNFIRLRNDSHAQYEIRVYAQAMFDIVKEICPYSVEAFEKYVVNAVKFTEPELLALSKIIDKSAKINSGLKGTELAEFQDKLVKAFGVKL